ncbi:uncharacterized protein BDR25DRAFT_348423 [Lindgomyces ingoldianus]|uniref:Uncharacterized protein n=1 Tax=Lindgomyces ingoldianus TaxID=673940 RepID=A0ACB6RGB0_9PLEO|nr:uncharacterized protein BDR25DRAFT_348423 [Lindgomyces ingoldianus]KAF2478151.1 hypothetical protein BDR25DRAFT_348423 [Lindgomyces ingoldianus]
MRWESTQRHMGVRGDSEPGNAIDTYRPCTKGDQKTTELATGARVEPGSEPIRGPFGWVLGDPRWNENRYNLSWKVLKTVAVGRLNDDGKLESHSTKMTNQLPSIFPCGESLFLTTTFYDWPKESRKKRERREMDKRLRLTPVRHPYSHGPMGLLCMFTYRMKSHCRNDAESEFMTQRRRPGQQFELLECPTSPLPNTFQLSQVEHPPSKMSSPSERKFVARMKPMKWNTTFNPSCREASGYHSVKKVRSWIFPSFARWLMVSFSCWYFCVGDTTSFSFGFIGDGALTLEVWSWYSGYRAVTVVLVLMAPPMEGFSVKRGERPAYPRKGQTYINSLFRTGSFLNLSLMGGCKLAKVEGETGKQFLKRICEADTHTLQKNTCFKERFRIDLRKIAPMAKLFCILSGQLMELSDSLTGFVLDEEINSSGEVTADSPCILGAYRQMVLCFDLMRIYNIQHSCEVQPRRKVIRGFSGYNAQRTTANSFSDGNGGSSGISISSATNTSLLKEFVYYDARVLQDFRNGAGSLTLICPLDHFPLAPETRLLGNIMEQIRGLKV